MNGVIRPLAFVLVAGAAMSVTPAREPQYSDQLLALLDPTTRVADLCGGAGPGGMRAKMMVAAAAVQGAPLPAAVPLYEGLGKVHFPITTSNPLAQRYFDQGLSWAYDFNHAGAIVAFREAQKALAVLAA